MKNIQDKPQYTHAQKNDYNIFIRSFENKLLGLSILLYTYALR